MRPSDQIATFVHDALAAGRSREDITGALTQAGWGPGEVNAALREWSDAPFRPPVPRPRPYVSARDAFIYALMLVALAMTAWHVVMLGFFLADRWIADLDAPVTGIGALRSMRFSVAALVVFVPLFFVLETYANRRLRRDPGHARSLVRKWFGQVTLFTASVVLLGDLIAAVYAFLNGDLTLRFAVRALVVAVVAGLILLHFRSELREEQSPAGRSWATSVLAVLAVAAILASLWGAGGPLAGRAEQRDTTRLEDLGRLNEMTNCLAREAGGVLPETLTPTPACPGDLRMVDPWTDTPYRYQPVTAQSFRLCADFETDLAVLMPWNLPNIDAPAGCIVHALPEPMRPAMEPQ